MFYYAIHGGSYVCNAFKCCPYIGIEIFNFRFFAKLIKLKFKLNCNGMEVSYFFIFCLLIVL